MRTESLSSPAWATETALSAEIRALIVCARAVIDPGTLTDLKAAIADCPNAEGLCRAAVTHGMLGNLQRALTHSEVGAFDPALVGRLTELQRVSAQRSLRQTAQLLRVLDALRTAGVEAIVFKGPVWAQLLYGDVTMRSWADLDLLVSHGEVPLAREVLLAQGFADGNRFNSRIVRRRRYGEGEIGLQSLDQGLLLEIHWEVGVGFTGRSLSAEHVLARAEMVELLGRPVLSPSQVDVLLITCIHGTRHRWDSIEGLLGLGIQVKGTAPDTWRKIMESARQAECARRVISAVAHACLVLGLEVPSSIGDEARGDVVVRALGRSLGPETLDPDAMAKPRRELGLLVWRFGTEDSLLAGLGSAAIRFFRPGPADWESVGLPHRLDWLYYLLRPLRLTAKWVKRLTPWTRGPAPGL